MVSEIDRTIDVPTRLLEKDGVAALLIDCADKRFTLVRPAAEWVGDTFGISPYTMTRPGPVRHFSKALPPLGDTANELSFYLDHGITTIFINAHDDCLANPESEVVQRRQLLTAIATLRKFGFAGRVIALYTKRITDHSWSVLPVWDTVGDIAPCP
jgi:hypothetical protein